VVTVRKRTLRGGTYYYLEHTARVAGKVQKRELYLGSRMPRDIEERKRAFLAEVHKERWHPLLERIRAGYAADTRRTPRTGKERALDALAVRFTYNTQRIEGSTLTLRETADLLERGITPAGRPLRDVKEAEAHRALFLEVVRERGALTLAKVLAWHHRLFRETRPDIAGRVRQHQIAISGSRFLPPSPVEIDPLLREFFRWYARALGRTHPVELAALVHLRFVTIHPFTDGNGRLSRLLMNFVLHRHGYPMMVIQYTGRSPYYTALERAQVRGLEHVFVQWLLRAYVKEHRTLTKTARAQSST